MNDELQALPFEFESTTRRPPPRRANTVTAGPAPSRSRYPATRPQQPMPSNSARTAGSAMVRQVQHRLNQLIGSRLRLTGLLDVPSRSALRRFQLRAGLPATGMLDPQTRSKLAGRQNANPIGNPQRSRAAQAAYTQAANTQAAYRNQFAQTAGAKPAAPQRPPSRAYPAGVRPFPAPLPVPYYSPYPPCSCQCQHSQPAEPEPASDAISNQWPSSQEPDQSAAQMQDQDQAQDQDQNQGQDDAQADDQGEFWQPFQF